MKHISEKKDVPTTVHYALVEFSSIYIEGDERSRTAPGHGYPGHSEHVCQYIVCENEEEWKAEIERRTVSQDFYRKNFIAFVAHPARIIMEVKVGVETAPTSQVLEKNLSSSRRYINQEGEWEYP